VSAPTPQTLQLGEITVHLARREVVHPTHRAKLTALEAKLLGYLASRAGELVTQAELLVDVWGYAPGVETRAPHHAVTRIRKKIEADPAAPVFLLTVFGEGYRLEAPAPSTPTPPATAPPTPAPRISGRPNAFVGRQAELDILGAWLEGSVRMITVTGPAGVGKTRLCGHFSALHEARFPGGSWLVELEGAGRKDELIGSIAGQLGIQLRVGDPVGQIGALLRSRGPALLVLDDLQIQTDFIAAWLGHAPDLWVMATARRRLTVPGQRMLPLRPLSPADARALLKARVQDDASAEATPWASPEEQASLVHRLDGLPLAIELAASRVRFIGMSAVLDRLDQRFRLLRGGSREIDPRKSDLRAVLDVSWNQLPPWAQLGLAQCAVFRGPFSLEAAEAVLDLRPCDPARWPMDALELLEDHSLLQVIRTDRRRPRFRLLHSVRDLALERLADPAAISDASAPTPTGPDAARAAQLRHAAFYATLGAPDTRRALQGDSGRKVWGQILEAADELQAALGWAVEAAALPEAIGLAAATQELAANRGPMNLSDHLVTKLLAHPALPLTDRVQLATRRARLQNKMGQWDASRQGLAEIDAVARAGGHPDDIADVSEVLGEVELAAGNLDLAQTYLTRALDCTRPMGDTSVQVLARIGLGQIFQTKGDLTESEKLFKAALTDLGRGRRTRMAAVLHCHLGSLDQERGLLQRARHQFTEAQEICREIGAASTELMAMGNLAGLHVELGQHAAARALLETTMQRARELGVAALEGRALANLGVLFYHSGALEDAEHALLESITLHEIIGDLGMAAISRGNLAEVLLLQDRDQEARRAIERTLEALKSGAGSYAWSYFLGVAAEARARTGDVAGAQRAFEEGEGMLRSEGRVVSLAKLLCRRGTVDLQLGAPDAARGRLQEAMTIAREAGMLPDAETWQDIRRLQDRLAAAAQADPAGSGVPRTDTD